MEKQLIRSGMQEHQSLVDKDSFAYSKCLLFADDLKLFSSMNNNLDAVLLQNDLDGLFKWCTVNKLHLNIEKCSILSYTRKSQPLNRVYKINDLVLSCSDSVTDLVSSLTLNLIFPNTLIPWSLRHIVDLEFLNAKLGNFRVKLP
ncbi:hypothetical protein AVEN_34407-1 [Araneus ventricosus]|uniref:Reverse transcriptase domain-containing protein n=1 Tax=Araneus ventricosus TaxID=182803 RepID=A0A4Y2G5P0_ARAVE|nr:hypothetical protein AVEN_34407-1 [Araneus ventricosus]